MSNQPAEAYHVRQYLVNCFISRQIANFFSTWAQANRYLSGDYDLEESLYLMSGDTRDGIIVISLPIDSEYL